MYRLALYYVWRIAAARIAFASLSNMVCLPGSSRSDHLEDAVAVAVA